MRFFRDITVVMASCKECFLHGSMSAANAPILAQPSCNEILAFQRILTRLPCSSARLFGSFALYHNSWCSQFQDWRKSYTYRSLPYWTASLPRQSSFLFRDTHVPLLYFQPRGWRILTHTRTLHSPAFVVPLYPITLLRCLQ